MLYRICLTVCTFILLSSCQFENRENNPRLLSLLEADALLVSNEESIELENNYYDAILELKKIYPTEMDEVVVISHNEIKNIQQLIKIKSYPTLLIINEKQIVQKIEGKQEKDYIVRLLASTFDKKK
jgi:hypothetical protein